jgi:hypothetical protein
MIGMIYIFSVEQLAVLLEIQPSQQSMLLVVLM